MKYLIDLRVAEAVRHSCGYVDLWLEPVEGKLPDIKAGQFVNIRTGGDVILRRPISVNDVDYAANRLRLLVKNLGRGTDWLYNINKGAVLNLLLPLGRGFDLEGRSRVLLAGGGVGTAPMMYCARLLKEHGLEADILLAAKNAEELVQIEDFRRLGRLHVATDDGSMGHKGFAASHPVLTQDFDLICVCGPMPMMKSVAAVARERGIDCQVSLENKMACGLGACLCCVEDTKEGNRCTCTDGPVFNLNELKW